MTKSVVKQMNYQSQFEQSAKVYNSPDLNKMFIYKVGSCTYFFRTKDKQDAFIAKHEKSMEEQALKQAAKYKYWEKVAKVEDKTCKDCIHRKSNAKYQYNCMITTQGAGLKRIRLSDTACIKFKSNRI